MLNDFEGMLPGDTGEGLGASGLERIQVNVGLLCNQRCRHCHLEASPDRSEVMDWPTMTMVLDAARRISPGIVDLTGGAPELNPNTRRFIEALREEGIPVQMRTNLTALLEPGMEDMPEFLRDNEVGLVASMPCYLEENVCAQRGAGVYEKSVEVIRRLNGLGYGAEPGLVLDLVYNPGGPSLPGPQSELEDAYRREFGARFGISFTHLLTITNMPIGRFGAMLRQQQETHEYMGMRRNSFNPATVKDLMCRRQMSIGWDGTLYDCDFNLALGLAMDHGAPDHIRDFDPSAIAGRRIVTGDHCFGCTAGAGSSCGGALE